MLNVLFVLQHVAVNQSPPSLQTADRMLVPLISITMSPPRGPTNTPTGDTQTAQLPPQHTNNQTNSVQQAQQAVEAMRNSVARNNHVSNQTSQQMRLKEQVNGQTTSSSASIKRSPNDFIFGKTIGEGSFSSVSINCMTDLLKVLFGCTLQHLMELFFCLGIPGQRYSHQQRICK